jgi:DNA-binding NarL/FixJ family response regulator
MTTPAKIRVLIVEDHPVYRDGLVGVIADAPDLELAAAVGTVAEANEQLDASVIHVALIDLGLPDGSGLGVVEHLRQRKVAALVLTMNDDRVTVLSAVRAGARGYLLKGAGRDEICSAIRLTAAGGSVFGALPADVLLAAASGTTADPVTALGLTAREGDVLRLVAVGMSNQAIATRLSLAPKTVRNQVSTILTKLGAADRQEATQRAISAGVVDDAPAGSGQHAH